MFPVSSREKALPFYRDFLGLRLVPSFEDFPGVTMLETDDGTMIHLSEKTERTPPTHVAFERGLTVNRVHLFRSAGETRGMQIAE